jgi:small multidrug resistance pump
MHWVLLSIAILSEVTGTTMLRLSNGFTRLWPSIGVVVFYGASFWLLSLLLRSLHVGFVYAVWSGLGTALVALVGWQFFGEPMTEVKVVSMGLIIAGVVGLNLSGAH